jgi:hypothetical protein
LSATTCAASISTSLPIVTTGVPERIAERSDDTFVACATATIPSKDSQPTWGTSGAGGSFCRDRPASIVWTRVT